MSRKKTVLRVVLGAGLLLGVLIAGLAGYVSQQPDEYSVQRSLTVKAAPEAAFAQINDFQAWGEWSPWIELDPQAKTSISTPSAGPGAVFGWSGNDEVGEGTLTIIESKAPERVEVEQTFVRPFPGTARMTFTFQPEGETTRVTWRLHGTHTGFVSKTVCTIMNMDSMLGPRMEQGLAGIRTVAEQPPAAPAP